MTGRREHHLPAWTHARVARPARDLTRSSRFYGDLLGLPLHDSFANHAGYDGNIHRLPGGAELELTNSPGGPTPRNDEELLVLYLATASEVQAVSASLTAAGVQSVRSPNPYWNRWGRTFLDPDGCRVVLAGMSR
jgi:catechol 2,3-dioxygenase-like lactoylglutathione lyase family enzyme